jgi:hypothetical protein
MAKEDIISKVPRREGLSVQRLSVSGKRESSTA